MFLNPIQAKQSITHWDRIVRFLERGDLPKDNGVDERVIRDLTIGRKNWMQIMSDEGGKRMAILYSIIAICKINCVINPEEYLNDNLMRVILCIFQFAFLLSLCVRL